MRALRVFRRENRQPEQPAGFGEPLNAPRGGALSVVDVGEEAGVDVGVGNAVPQQVPRSAIVGSAAPDARHARREPVGEDDGMPRFRTSPLERGGPRQLAAGPRQAAFVALWNAFTPTQPKRQGRLFAGRVRELARVISAIEEERAHVVIYGDRGFGKTSLSNIVADAAVSAGFHVVRGSCGSEMTFEDVFRTMLQGIPGRLARRPRGSGITTEHFGQYLPSGTFGAMELTEALGHLDIDHVILVIDEFDRVVNDAFRVHLAEAIKNLSDEGVRVTFFIVGVSSSLESLLGKHPSIQRNVVGVHLPLMSAEDLWRIITAGAEVAGLEFGDEVRRSIVGMSRGLPYFTQLLCFHAGRRAIERDSRWVEREDLRTAVDRAVEEADHLVIDCYDRANRADKNAFMTDVLYAAARAPCDPFGRFSAEDAAEIRAAADGEEIPILTMRRALASLSSDERPMLEKHPGAAETRFSFNHQTMPQYILARQAEQRGIL